MGKIELRVPRDREGSFQTGTFEVTLFPKTYRKYAVQILNPGPYFVEGRIEDDSGVLSQVAERLALV